MEEQIKQSLQLFSEFFLNSDGTINPKACINANTRMWDYRRRNFPIFDMENDGASRIIGRSFFSPTIQVRNERNGTGKGYEERYYLTLDDQGPAFDHHFKVSPKKGEIDVTHMSKGDILKEVEKLLNLSNAGIIKKFDLLNDGINFKKLMHQFLLHDDINEFMLKRGYTTIRYYDGNPEFGLKTIYGNGKDQEIGIDEEYSHNFNADRRTCIRITIAGYHENIKNVFPLTHIDFRDEIIYFISNDDRLEIRNWADDGTKKISTEIAKFIEGRLREYIRDIEPNAIRKTYMTILINGRARVEKLDEAVRHVRSRLKTRKWKDKDEGNR